MRHNYQIHFTQTLDCPKSDLQQGIKLYYLPIEDRYQSIRYSKLETDRPAEVITCCDEQENPMICVLPDSITHKIQLSFSCEVTIKRQRQPDLAQTELLYSKLFDFMPWQRICLFEYTQPLELSEHTLSKLHHYLMQAIKSCHQDPINSIRKFNQIAFQQPIKLRQILNKSAYIEKDNKLCSLWVFVLLCRIVSIPTRYVSGYLKCFSFKKDQHFVLHHWAEVYLPYVGWMGFDPIRYRLVNHYYIRCAVFTHQPSSYQAQQTNKSSNPNAVSDNKLIFECLEG